MKKAVRRATPKPVRKAKAVVKHPVGTAARAATPRSVREAKHKAFNATHPLNTAENALLNAATPKRRSRSAHALSKAPPAVGNTNDATPQSTPALVRGIVRLCQGITLWAVLSLVGVGIGIGGWWLAAAAVITFVFFAARSGWNRNASANTVAPSASSPFPPSGFRAAGPADEAVYVVLVAAGNRPREVADLMIRINKGETDLPLRGAGKLWRGQIRQQLEAPPRFLVDGVPPGLGDKIAAAYTEVGASVELWADA